MRIKKLLFTIAASMMLVSCADEIVGVDTQIPKPISFSSNYVGSSTSRAVGDINNTNVRNSSFYVYGQSYDGVFATANNFVTIFDQQIVSNVDGKWSYSPIKYWDSEKKYTFTAVMPEDINASDITYTDDNRIKITNIPLCQPILDQDENDYGVDYLVSKSVDNCTANSGTVYLQFKHLLSRFSIFVYTSANDADVTVNSMHLYLPNGTADYEEVNHNEPISNVVNASITKQEGDVWTWDGFMNKVDGVNSTYQKYSLLSNKNTSVKVPFYDGIPTISDAKLMPIEFFMAPIDKSKLAKKEDLQLYMDISFHVKYSDNIEQDIVRTTPIKVQDLHSFTQNYKTNLFIKLLSEEDIISFKVAIEDYENTTNHWVDQYGYSFNLAQYSQTFDETFPQNEISGILYDYGNTTEGDSETKMTYAVKSLTLEGETTPIAENLPMVFSKWSSSENGTYSTDTDIRTKDHPYGKFTVDLSDVTYTDGDYVMVVENSMGDVREYLIKLQRSAFMAFTVSVADNDNYTIPFVTYETVYNYWNSTVGKYLKSGGVPITMEMVDDITSDENKNQYFKYPSNLRIDWGDGTNLIKIEKGSICKTDPKLTHRYESAGDYQIVIHSDAPYGYEQIPQINWGSQATTNNPIAFVNNGGSTDCKIKSADTPILQIYDAWAHWETTFGAYALAAGNGATYDWMVDIVYSRLNPSFHTSVKSSPLTSMYHNSSIQHVCDDLFIYNTKYAQAADYTFLMCESLDNIGKGMFDYCSNIVSMVSTFQGDNMKIRVIPDGLFNYLTKNVYFKQTFAIGDSNTFTYIPSDLFAKCGSGSIYTSLGGGVTAPK